MYIVFKKVIQPETVISNKIYLEKYYAFNVVITEACFHHDVMAKNISLLLLDTHSNFA